MNNFVKVSLPLKQNDKQMTTSSANQSGTGVFYQALPAVGADGKNVMKLIPVQRVNGQFVRMQANNNLPSTYRKASDFEPQRLFAHPIHLSPNAVSHNKVPVLQPAISGRYILKRPSDVNVMLNPVAGTGRCNERVTVSTPIQVQVPIVATNVAQTVPVASPVLNCGKTLTLLNKKQLPVTVKSPVLPNGHYLQIPPNAQVKTLPASALPQAIKRRILTPPVSTTTTSSSATNLPTVVYVSPVNTMKLGPSSRGSAVPPAPLSLNRLPKPSGQNLVVGPAQPIKSIPKETRDPVTPIKWVVQERSDSTAPCLVPQNSSTMTSEILKTLAQMERVNGMGQSTAPKPTSSQASPTRVGPGKDNALLMCNGKVYFVAKKTPEFSDHSPDMQKISGTVNSPSKQTTVDDNINQRNKPSSPSLPTSSFPGPPVVNSPRQGMGHIVINDGPDEIIDLCDDDPQDECVSQRQSNATLPQPDSSELAPDEDEDSNVIFVSYIPPKSSTESADDEREVVQEKSAEDQHVLEKERGQEKATSLEQETNPENVYVEENLIQQNVEASQTPKNETDNELVSRIPDNSVKNIDDPGLDHHIAASKPKSRLEQDRQLKRRFQITSDVKICLQRIPPESRAIPEKGPRFSSVNKRTLDGIRKLMQESRIDIKKKSVETPVLSVNEKGKCSSQDPKRKKVEICENSDIHPYPGSTYRPNHPDNDPFSERAKSPSRAVSITGSLTSPVPSEKPELVNIVIQESMSTSTREVTAAVVPSVTQESGLRTKEHGIISRNIPKAKTLQPRSRKGKGKQCRGVPETTLEKETPEEDILEISSVPGEESSPSKLEMANKDSEMTAPAEVPLEVAMQDEEPGDISEQEEEPTSVEICCPSPLSELSCNGAGETPGGDLFTAAPMDPEEIKRHEKIKRLKELLKEKEAALEMIRKNLI
ncbi:ligand-dependent nuclear receptor-interacting factor 1 [Anguilla rostrata]|uniref:ligand-dependent nuclear receptor-interacting factor 1 n=1 Tax=Anguilla rostrata TaxID=7938 RepID=UPI0030D28615